MGRNKKIQPIKKIEAIKEEEIKVEDVIKPTLLPQYKEIEKINGKVYLAKIVNGKRRLITGLIDVKLANKITATNKNVIILNEKENEK